ncbi:MAG TPA: helix-turn-helix transcriptional regulator [Tepidisphaeraceae bacterium]|nr:helix-turn-helix transcriptional regulator [Tepidisphaeraceae bacterium]
MIPNDGNFFRTRREQLGRTQRQIANALGMTPVAVSHWENGRVPSIHLVPRLARVYETSERTILDAMLEISKAATTHTAEPIPA